MEGERRENTDMNENHETEQELEEKTRSCYLEMEKQKQEMLLGGIKEGGSI